MAIQRFCPLCDRAFVESEALLVCEGCGVMYHPSCWVRNDGCTTAEPHDARSRAMAYRIAEPGVTAAIQPSESMRPQRGIETATASDAAVIDGPAVAADHRDGIGALDAGNAAVPEPFQPPPRPHDHSAVIGEREPAPPPRLASRPLEPPGAPVRHGRYVPPDEEFVTIRKQMPGIYRERRWLQYWYIPVAAAIAVIVAGGVVYGANLLFGGDDGDDSSNDTVFVASPTATTTSAATVASTAESTSAAGGTLGPSTTTTATRIATAPPTGGKFQVADTLVVTGAGDCLNVRTAPDRLQPAIVCLKDGAEVAVTGGPQQADSFTWWKVMTALGEGWAVEDFLAKKP